jgi:GNAT superfamily N-acetyltransferase
MIVREAGPSDAAALADLVSRLGYPATAGEIAARLPGMLHPVLVAEREGEVVACMTWHVTPALHRAGPVGRITMLVVAEDRRGQGVGKALVEAVEQRTRDLGCVMVEVSSNMRRADAHAFYERLGFERTSYRFAKVF